MRLHGWLLLPLLSLVTACAGAPPPTQTPQTPAAWDHDWARGAVFYEVFVRSFADSDGNGIGDLQGLISRLDYLNDGNPATSQDLGVDALWLMPVFDSPSYHGYDTVDYETIEPDYGTNADFERLLAEAHRRGIRVIVDYVMNHSSSKHPWFLESAASATSPRRAWYEWRTDDPGWRQPWGGGPVWHKSPREDGTFYYGIFWSGMPDLNWRTPAVREEMNRIAADWLRRGVDGFRLDATRHLVANGPGEGQNNQPETHEALKGFAAHVRGVSPTAMLVGENWTDTPSIATYYGDLPMNFNFPLAEEIVRGVETGEASGIAAKLSEMAELYPPGALDAPFLTNHDMFRLATQLANDPAKLRSAAAILLTLPGAPFLYYGEEVGLLNGGADRADELKRTPMPWDATPGGGFTTAARPWYAFAPGREAANVAAQTGDPSSLLSHYRNLIRARKSSNALRRGNLSLLSPVNRSVPVLAFLREHQGERLLVFHNVSAGEEEVFHGGPTQSMEPVWVTEGTPAPTRDADGWTVRLPAGASGVWRVK